MSPSAQLLIVDAADALVTALRPLAQRHGIGLLHARSGARALELLLEHEIVAVLVEADLPAMDGLQLAELLRAGPRTQHIPLLMLAGAGIDLHRLYALPGDGSVDHLQRPPDMPILQAKLAALLRQHAQRRRQTQELDSMQQTLRLNEMFAAVLGHDLRSPLSAIMVSAELVIVRNKDASDVAAALRIRDSAKRMSHLISQLIDMARVRSGHVSLLLQDCDIATICRDVVSEIEATQQRQVLVEISGDTRGTWDPHRLSQIVSNLGGNAVKHGDARQPVCIRIDGSQPDHLHCSVHNGGVIPPELLPQIFKPFRGYGEGNRRAGLGLGLYIVQQLVTMHGGDIRVRSSAAEGTVFAFRLKRRCGAITALAAPPAQPA